MKLQHRAVDLAEKHQLMEVLFPSGAAEPTVSIPELRSGLKKNYDKVLHLISVMFCA